MKNKSIAKSRPEGSRSSLRKSSPDMPATISNGSDDNSELKHQLSSTDVDEESMEESVLENHPRHKEDGSKGKKNLTKIPV